MAPGDLSDALNALSLVDSDYLLFQPGGETAWIQKTFAKIPRFLIRIFTPRSDGFTNEFWVKSKAARYGRKNGNIDIFAIEDREQVATSLNRYLRWRGTPADADNLVSWTSSLLLALQYIFYRHKHEKDRSSLEDIKLCIVDTAIFPERVFVRDMDLIDAYRQFNVDLENLKCLRTRKHRYFAGSYYFGEYLSQGALRIEGNCQIVSAQAIIDKGLFLLKPELQESLKDSKPRWADEVIRLREPFSKANKQQMTTEEFQAVVNIALLFEPRWRLPLAAKIVALQPRRRGDETILCGFRAAPFTDRNREDCSPSKTKIIAYDTLPEVKQYKDILRSVYADFRFNKLKAYIELEEAELRNVMIHIYSSGSETGHSILGSDYDPTVFETGSEILKRRLDMVLSLGHFIQEPT